MKGELYVSERGKREGMRVLGNASPWRTADNSLKMLGSRSRVHGLVSSAQGSRFRGVCFTQRCRLASHLRGTSPKPLGPVHACGEGLRVRAHGSSGFMVQGSWFMVQGSWFRVRGSGIMVRE
eukprot:3447947-Rhodomonas_salina.1